MTFGNNELLLFKNYEWNFYLGNVCANVMRLKINDVILLHFIYGVCRILYVSCSEIISWMPALNNGFFYKAVVTTHNSHNKFHIAFCCNVFDTMKIVYFQKWKGNGILALLILWWKNWIYFVHLNICDITITHL